MAEGFARQYGTDILEAHSAGIAPAAKVSRVTQQVMRERNVDLDGQVPKSIAKLDLESFDLIVNLSDYALPKTQTRVVSCPVRDPMGRGEDFHRDVRNRVEWIVKNLIVQFREASREPVPQPVPVAKQKATAAEDHWGLPV